MSGNASDETARRLRTLAIGRDARVHEGSRGGLRRAASVLAVILGAALLVSVPELRLRLPRGGPECGAAAPVAAGEAAPPAGRAAVPSVTGAATFAGRIVPLTVAGFVVPASGIIEVAARTAGRIEEVRVEAGQRVAAGELLMRLDDRPARAVLEQIAARLGSARAEQALARVRLGRVARLRDAGLIAVEEWEREQGRAALVDAQVREQEAALARQRLELEFTEVRAPQNGVVLEVRRRAGEVVLLGPQEVPWLLAMSDLDDLRVVVDIHEADLPRLELHQSASVTPDASPERSYAARVVAIGPRANRQKGTVPVELAILEPDGLLRPDASARVRFASPGS